MGPRKRLGKTWRDGSAGGRGGGTCVRIAGDGFRRGVGEFSLWGWRAGGWGTGGIVAEHTQHSDNYHCM